jgi:hypothetical protein
MWPKTSEDWAYKWHFRVFKKLHPEHNTDFGNDYNDEFCDKMWKYKRVDLDKFIR